MWYKKGVHMTERIILDIHSFLPPTAFIEELLKEIDTRTLLLVLNGTYDTVSKYMTQYDKYIALYLIESDKDVEVLKQHTGPSDTMYVQRFSTMKYTCLVAPANKPVAITQIINELKGQIYK